MPAAILHFGREIEECFPLLRRSGYSIDCCQDDIDFGQVRQGEVDYDLVSSSDIESEMNWVAAERAREYFLVPAVLFQAGSGTRTSRTKRQVAKAETSDYDLVIPADEGVESWIPEIDDVIARGGRLRGATRRIIANSIQLRQETARVTGRTNREIERAKSLCEQDYLSRPISNMLADRVIQCRSCGESFVFTAGEQLLFQLRRAMHVPDKCGKCNFDSSYR